PLTFPLSFNDTSTTDIHTLSLHDALPILPALAAHAGRRRAGPGRDSRRRAERPRPLHPALGGTARGGRLRLVQRRDAQPHRARRSEEHTSELQSPYDLVCRLLLEKKKKNH